MKKNAFCTTKMHLELQPFLTESDLQTVQWNVRDVDVEMEVEVDDDHFYAEYGFLRGSMQYNFLMSGSPSSLVFLRYTSDGARPAPRHMADDRVVARLFGSFDTKHKSFTIWHVSVRKQHAYNNSLRGQRWGFGNLVSNNKKQLRWKDASTGKGVTRRTADRYVKGTPNPYAAEAIVATCTLLGCVYMEQHPMMPCAQLFSPIYSHASHPSIYLLYKALDFDGTEHLAWDASIHRPMDQSMQMLHEAMMLGLPMIS